MSIYSEYFGLTNQYTAKYGKKTLIAMQVGAFFEIYGTKQTKRSQIDEISQICQLAISEKNASYENDIVLMAGFRDYTLEKYVQTLCEAEYTTVVFVQEITIEKGKKNIHRVLQNIYSPGTYISYDADYSPITNNILCIWIDTYLSSNSGKSVTSGKSMASGKKWIVYGIANVNIMTGESTMFEHQTEFLMNPTTFDEMERYISVYCPSEVLLISASSDDSDNLFKYVSQYAGIKCTIHSFDAKTDEKVQKCTSQNYIEHILSTFFGVESYNICAEFRENAVATQALCYLIHFIQEHNPDLVRKFRIPEFNNTSDRMILANHTLSQLNIIGSSNDNSVYSSVLAFLNKTCTTMGKRLFKRILTQPTTNQEWLNREYTMTANLLEHSDFIPFFRKEIAKIRDLEKIGRQIVTKRIYPASIWSLYTGISTVHQILTCLMENPELYDYLCEKTNSMNIPDQCVEFMGFMDKWLYIDRCKTMNTTMQTFEQPIIRTGISNKLDVYTREYEDHVIQFKSIHECLNQILRTKGNDDTEYVKIHETEKSGSSLQITKKRATLLKQVLESKQTVQIPIGNGRFIHVNVKDIKFTTANTANDEIVFQELTTICKNIETNKKHMDEESSLVYLQFLAELEKQWYSHIEILSTIVARIDVLQCKAYIAREYRYCRPQILNRIKDSETASAAESDSEKSFVQSKGLRHPLIEHIQKNELYVENDVSLGIDGTDGILLYGTNAVGKTSMIRALGISIILAQAGMYVPCSEFVYWPYTAIYSRILGNDNLFKGLSTFAVEMSELRVILKMADQRSLILGDELCSGTETGSALSIFTAGLMHLHKTQSSFIFATHFHEIIYYEEIAALDRMKMMHMTVIYDRERDCLVYDRRLKPGAGNHLYGLEVCKSLYLESEFLECAYMIRNKYNVDGRGELSNPNTAYNTGKIRGLCEICNKMMGEEIHHLLPQKLADADGYIGSVHKNHKANLISICEKCHKNIHHTDTINNGKMVTKKVKTTKGFMILSNIEKAK